MWSLSRRVLSFGLRMTLQRMQDNITSMQNFRRTVMLPQQSSFSLSRSILTKIKYEPAALESKKGETNDDDSDDSADPADLTLNRQQIGAIQGKLKLCFTCKRCGTRNIDKIITKLSYTKGVVIVRCDGCRNNHLIADNLGWFGPGNKSRNIETILREKGENVRRIRDDSEGYFEAVAQEEVIKVQRLMMEQQRQLGNNTSKDEEKSAKLVVDA